MFDATLPNLVTGQCPVRMKPVFRLWNQRSDSNHRYTTSHDVANAMRGQGFVLEGYGPGGVALCALDRP